MRLGQLIQGDPDLVAQQLWTAMHGFVMLELAGLPLSSKDPEAEVFRPLMDALLTGLSTPQESRRRA